MQRAAAEKKSALAGGGEVDILGLQASKQWVLHKFTSKQWLCTPLGHSLHCLHSLHSLHCLHCLHYFLRQSDHIGAAAVLYASFNALPGSIPAAPLLNIKKKTGTTDSWMGCQRSADDARNV